MSKTYYHWTNGEGTLGYGDGRKVVVGETLEVLDKAMTIKCCRYGMHSSTNPLDALRYAPGCRLWEVSHPSGIVDRRSDKQAGVDRRAVFDYGDCTDLVVKFAQWCAKRAEATHAAVVYAMHGHGAYSPARSVARSAAATASHASYAASAAASAAAVATATATRSYAASTAAGAKEQKAQKAWWRRQLRKRKAGGEG